MLAQSLESIFMKASKVDNTQRAAMQIIKRGKKGKKNLRERNGRSIPHHRFDEGAFQGKKALLLGSELV